MIRNIYIPPASSCNQGYVPPISSLMDGLGDTSLVMGDLNAHNPLWYSEDTEDARGKRISDWISDTGFGLCNEDTATRTTATASTAPDLSIATPNLLPACSWTVRTALSSDHLPIHLSLTTQIRKISAANRTFINFNKADWEKFQTYTEEIFSTVTLIENTHKSEKFFRDTFNKATKLFIPAGRIPKIINAMPRDAAKLVEERDQLRLKDPSNKNLK